MTSGCHCVCLLVQVRRTMAPREGRAEEARARRARVRARPDQRFNRPRLAGREEEQMTPATTAMPTFSDEQIVEFMELLKGADSVELKLTVPEPHHRSTIAALELDTLEAQIRQVFFFDTP